MKTYYFEALHCIAYYQIIGIIYLQIHLFLLYVFVLNSLSLYST